ncbi:MAG: glycosyltransferase family 39 protein [Phycisphaerae bacterium]|nr:glycosyltransferase family 39 protein [Phycisphaerae bacterium]
MLTTDGDHAAGQPLLENKDAIGDRAAMPSGFRSMGLLLLLLSLTTCFAWIGSGPSMGDHECICAQTARQTIQSGNWLIPQLAEIPRIRKTPLGYWAIAATSWLLDDPNAQPVSDLTARLPSALAAFLNSLAVWWLGTMMFGQRAGFVAGFVMGCCATTVLFSHSAQVDMILALFTTLTFACFWRAFQPPRPSRPFIVIMFACFSAAMMAKAPLPMATAGAALTLWWFVAVPILNTAGRVPAGGRLRFASADALAQWSRLPWPWVLTGLVVFAVLAGSWPLYIRLEVDNAAALWKIEYLERFSGGLSERGKDQPFYYYLPFVFGLTAPFLCSLPEALAAPFLRRYVAQRKALAFAFIWAICGLVFLSAAGYKRPHYLVSIMPAYCLLLAPVIDRLFFGMVSRWLRPTAAVLPILLGLLLVAGSVVVQEDLHTQSSSNLSLCLRVALPVFTLLTLSCLLFAFGVRVWSFVLLNTSTALLTVLGVPAARQFMDVDTEAKALVRGFTRHGIGVSDPIYWVGGRPDATVEFYHGYRLQRLINELEMADLRRNRLAVQEEVYREFEKRIRTKLAEPRPVYLIMTSGHLDLLKRGTNLSPRIVFELSGYEDKPGKELVVITQPDGPARRAETRVSG